MQKTSAQPVYAGKRVAVFDMEISQQKSQSLTLRCRMANTGRQALDPKSDSVEMVVELDTFGLPRLLRGHEAAIAEAVRGDCPRLEVGEVSGPVWLKLRIRPRADPAIEETGRCAEIQFDTAWVEEWGEQTMQIRFFLKNTGSAAAHFFSKNAEPLVNAYFVSGTKLTRGAIPAGKTSIRKGRETLDGLLLSGQALEATIELDLRDRTKFSPNIALEFDPAQAVDECGREGNIWVIKLRF